MHNIGKTVGVDLGHTEPVLIGENLVNFHVSDAEILRTCHDKVIGEVFFKEGLGVAVGGLKWIPIIPQPIHGPSAKAKWRCFWRARQIAVRKIETIIGQADIGLAG